MTGTIKLNATEDNKLRYNPSMQNEFEWTELKNDCAGVTLDPVGAKISGALHYAKDSGNFGLNSNRKVRFAFF